jgi:hypothetical protein
MSSDYCHVLSCSHGWLSHKSDRSFTSQTVISFTAELPSDCTVPVLINLYILDGAELQSLYGPMTWCVNRLCCRTLIMSMLLKPEPFLYCECDPVQPHVCLNSETQDIQCMTGQWRQYVPCCKLYHMMQDAHMNDTCFTVATLSSVNLLRSTHLGMVNTHKQCNQACV